MTTTNKTAPVTARAFLTDSTLDGDDIAQDFAGYKSAAEDSVHAVYEDGRWWINVDPSEAELAGVATSYAVLVGDPFAYEPVEGTGAERWHCDVCSMSGASTLKDWHERPIRNGVGGTQRVCGNCRVIDLVCRTVKLYQEGVPHADPEAALHLLCDITTTDADLDAVDATLREQEHDGPDLNVCADCGGSTAPGTPDPHECAPAPGDPAAAVVAILKGEGIACHWESFLSCIFLPITPKVSLVYGTQHGPWQGNLSTEDGNTGVTGWPSWEPMDLPVSATPEEVAAVLRDGLRTFKEIAAREIVVTHGRFRASYRDDDGSGEGMVHVSEERDGQWHDHGLATYWHNDWNDLGDVGGAVPDDDLEELGRLISDVLDAEEKRAITSAAPTTGPASREAAEAWINVLADAFTDADGNATPLAVGASAKAIAETLGSFLSCLAEDVSNTKDAADFGARVATTLTGLLGGLQRDIGVTIPAVPGMVVANAPWTFAEELAK
jgi:hypothetical protein